MIEESANAAQTPVQNRNPNRIASTTNLTNSSIKDQQIQAERERTLFCINIDQKCTEDILYELFLQVNHYNLLEINIFLSCFM